MSRERYRAEAVRWLSQARADLRAAEGSVRNQTFEWAAFQSQQAAEKALKSLWLHHAADPWGHSVVALVQAFPVEEVADRLAPLLDDAKKLDKLYIPTRYPNGLPDLTPAEVYTRVEAEDAIASARRFVERVTELTAG